MQPEKRNKILLITGVVGFVGLIMLLWFFLGGPGSKVTVEIFVAPSDAHVTMDSKSIKAGKVSLPKGTHTFEASRQHFGSIKKTVDLNNLDPSKTVYLALYPNSPEGEVFLQNNPDEQLRYERVAGAEFSALQEKIRSEYPITTQLPHQTIEYKIDYDINENKEVVFLVVFDVPQAIPPGTDTYKQELVRLKNEVLAYLESQGVDVDKARITYSPDPNQQP